MKSALFLLLFLLGSVRAFAQHDASLWFRSTPGTSQAYPWYTYAGKRVFFDVRYNFDWTNTGAVYIGKDIGRHGISVIPEIGILAGEYNGISPEMFILGHKKRVSFFVQMQYVKGWGNHPDFFYHWVDCQFDLRRWISVGVDEETLHIHSRTQVNLGPAMKLTFGKMYLKVWPAVSVGPVRRGTPIVYVGIGRAW